MRPTFVRRSRGGLWMATALLSIAYLLPITFIDDGVGALPELGTGSSGGKRSS